MSSIICSNAYFRLPLPRHRSPPPVPWTSPPRGRPSPRTRPATRCTTSRTRTRRISSTTPALMFRRVTYRSLSSLLILQSTLNRTKRSPSFTPPALLKPVQIVTVQVRGRHQMTRHVTNSLKSCITLHHPSIKMTQ